MQTEVDMLSSNIINRFSSETLEYAMLQTLATRLFESYGKQLNVSFSKQIELLTMLISEKCDTLSAIAAVKQASKTADILDAIDRNDARVAELDAARVTKGVIKAASASNASSQRLGG